MRAYRRRPLAGTTLAAVLALAGVGLSGCFVTAEEAREPTTPVEVPDIRGESDLADPYSGVFDADFADDLPAYTGTEVTLRAEVAEVVSPRVFTITSPDGGEVGPVLVVATEEAGDVDPQPGTPLVVAATPVASFDAGVVAEELALDVGPEQLAEWDGQTFLVAEVLAPAP
ncbi:hypothetical protein SAMN06893096_102308 [Geodermatophilus pulveris]|uniref:Lipoprotein n=1 Tax=Geodermatophilus pulveris TaxID=1564159 RepID=A0A239CAL2_9ACTN|nr:hypothetical protein [Geodermatophilus pulveris]SNS16504.1 hypothetical protein SAMN06893096_102308 [Geodermatophilus pulveris]